MTMFTGIRLEGGLLGPDTIEQIIRGELPGQRSSDFGLDGRRNLTDEIAAVFADSRKLWEVFQHRLQRLSEDDIGTSVTRDTWMIPFLGLFGIELRYNPRAYEIDGMTFAISHRMGEPEDSPPVHIVGARQELGRLAASGRPRLAPHSLVQEYLNRTEHLWGIVSNGLTLRLLRDSTSIRRQAYIEFDLQAIIEEQLFNDFALLYRLLHRTRFPRGAADPKGCYLERYYRHSEEQGGRVREHLRDGVEQCIKILAEGFLRHPHNEDLRRRVLSSSNDRISAGDLYRQLLRLIYRFLFLLVSEDRGLLSSHPVYRDHYGIGRLRRLLQNRSWFSEHDDIWRSLQVLWKVLASEDLSPLLGLPTLNGQLFEEQDLDLCTISNRNLLEAFWYLTWYQEQRSSPPRRINYFALDTEELGSVYESLLDYHPTIDATGAVPRFELVSGSERKSTGSYYTPPQLVNELIQSALEPVMKERLETSQEDKEKALLSIRVCDPACGSGHFLLAAARRLGKELARLRTGEDEPAPERVREATRDVISHCIYGVDKNPLAVDLCRVALWLESHTGGKPLTFLDHRIRCGDSLIGVFDLNVLKDGIPDKAFEPLEGDDKTAARAFARRNRDERKGQEDLFAGRVEFSVTGFSTHSREIEAISDDSPVAIRHKKQLFEKSHADPNWQRQKLACDLWAAAFFQPLKRDSVPITSGALANHLAGRPIDARVMAQAQVLSFTHGFFHWPLEFPEVFENGGFDLLLANPPWERIKLQEQEFFASRDARIAQAPNAAARKRLIERLPQDNPALWEEYRRALHTAESASRFLRASGDYPLTGRGDINTYSVFAERIRQLLAPQGRAGVILPTGIATDATNQYFFADLVEKGQIVSLFDFENREGIFPGVHRSYKFCLLTLRGDSSLPSPLSLSPLSLSFFATRAAHLRDPRRVFTLSGEDIARINPNTRTLPVFRTRQDAELTKAIYARVPVLVNEAAQENPWGVRFLAMFHMSNDSHLFRTRAELEAEGCRLEGNRFVRGKETYLPLYEAKMIWHYDHRFGTYEGVSDRASTQLPTPDARRHADPHFLALSWYWVSAAEVQARLGEWKRGWLIGFRNVTNATNERTAIFSLLPLAGVGNSLPILLLGEEKVSVVACLVGNLSALAFDWVARQKLAGVNMNFFYVQQFPVLPPTAYTAADLRFIVPRVLELTYTAWDLAPFAADVWNDADDPSTGSGQALRAAIQAQWEANRAATGGVDPSPPAWAENHGAPFPPFKWDESRRALLRAELDAYYARLYGLARKQLRYILDPADLIERELADILDPWEEVTDPLDPQGYAERAARSDPSTGSGQAFPGETFRVLKEKELREYGEYRTRRMALEAWEKLDLTRQP